MARYISLCLVRIGLRHYFSPWYASWFHLAMVRPDFECSMFCEPDLRFIGEEADVCIRRYNAFTTRIEELGLDNMVDAKPLLNVG